MTSAAPSSTVGVDMATDPRRTAAVLIEWNPGRARIRDVRHPCTDDDVIGLARLPAVSTVGIDCALGWPTPFLEFLQSVRDGTDPRVPDAEGPAQREGLSMRATDLHVHRVTGRRPLSVATDRLGLVAIRTASILAGMRDSGLHVSRDGSGRVAEVYPAAALKLWGISAAGYKKNAAVRRRIVDELAERMPWLDWGEAGEAAAASDHVLDAVLCSLLARAVATGRAEPPTSETPAALAREEGWIMLPTCSPDELVGG